MKIMEKIALSIEDVMVKDAGALGRAKWAATGALGRPGDIFGKSELVKNLVHRVAVIGGLGGAYYLGSKRDAEAPKARKA